ncbi:Uma2 family endonuclease [Okeania sp. KiyG1]|uniref:Uma2 family endonuclease n=1 Tax=Okeania sp. KiyG1 TaxID=2720165 RepID=UPI0019221A32|nr:Uma2 family endonuclease [Okeania sp. KiyG1]
MSVPLLKRQFNVKEYNKMPEVGILKEDERVELIRGEILKMSPVGRHHAACVNRLTRLFSQRLGDRVLVSVQNPIELGDYSEPEPDIALLELKADFYESGHPQSQDLFLIVEVADSTIKFDREVKVPLYAENNVIEVWLVDINKEYLEVYRQPIGGSYKQVQKLERGEIFSVQRFPDINIQVDEILG